MAYRPTPEREARIENIIKRHDNSSFQQEINRGFPINHIFYKKRTANQDARVFCLLELCVICEFVLGVDFLLRQPSILRRSSFSHVCINLKYSLIRMFLQNACDINKHRLEYLHILLVNRLFSLAEEFIQMPGYDVNEIDLVISSSSLKYGRGNIKQSPLHLSVVYEQKQILEKLISLDANLDCLDSEDNTPLHLSCVIGSYSTCQLLLQNGASTFWVDSHAQHRSAMYASLCLSLKSPEDNLDIINLLLAAGLNINRERWLSTTPTINKISQSASLLLLKSYKAPSQLESMCIKTVRTHLLSLTHGQSIAAKLEALSLPPLLKSILRQQIPGHLRLGLNLN